MVELINWLAQRLHVSEHIISWVVLILLSMWWARSSVSSSRQNELIAQLRKDGDELQCSLGSEIEKLNQTVADVDGRLSKIMERFEELRGIAIEDRQKQAERVKIEITRFFSGNPAAGTEAYVFATVHNTSADSIYDCVIDVLVRGKRKKAASERVGWVWGHGNHKLRFTLDKTIMSTDDVDFSITFFDYGQRRWRLVHGASPVQLNEDLTPGWVYRRPQTQSESE